LIYGGISFQLGLLYFYRGCDILIVIMQDAETPGTVSVIDGISLHGNFGTFGQ